MGNICFKCFKRTKYEDRLFEYLNNLFKIKKYSKFKNNVVNPDDINGLSAQAPHRPIRSLEIEDGIINSKQLLEAIDKIILKKKIYIFLIL